MVLLWWVFRGQDLNGVGEQIRRASLSLLLLGALMNIAHIPFRVLRWRYLLDDGGRQIPFRPLFVAVVVGYMTSWILPGRLGEIVRPMLLSSRTDVSLGPALGSVVGDRLLDAVTVAALFGVASLLVPLEGAVGEHAALIRGGAGLIATVSIAALIVMVLVSRSADTVRRRSAEARGPIRWVIHTVLSLAEGVKPLVRPRVLFWVAVHSVLAWVAIGLSTYLCIRASGVEIPLAGVWLIMPLLVLGIAVPTPGGAGSYHLALKTGVMLFGVTELLALGAGLLTHLASTLPVLLLGLLFLWTEKISWRDMLAAARSRPTAARAG